MTEPQQPEKKIIVDEDWKSRAQREKEEAATKQSQSPKGDFAAEATAGQSEADPEMPPASFSVLVSSLATQAMVALGAVADEQGKPTPRRMNLAKHLIDTLSVLEEKTKGNLNGEEQGMLDEVLHQLRMMYVAAQNQPPQS